MKQALACLSFVLAAGVALAQDAPADNPLIEGGTWEVLRGDITGDTPLLDGATLFRVTAPYRANDAATVPVVIEQTDPAAGPITAIKLVIDENPAPLAAEIRFGPAMDPLKFETRVRVNQYSNIRVIADTASGSYMSGRFVKASGGCSAPATKDAVAALAGLGRDEAEAVRPRAAADVEGTQRGADHDPPPELFRASARPDHPAVHRGAFHRAA